MATARQFAAVARAHLVASPSGPSAGRDRDQAYIDIDSLLRPVYGHAKQGARFGHTKIAGKRSSGRGCRRWR